VITVDFTVAGTSGSASTSSSFKSLVNVIITRYLCNQLKCKPDTVKFRLARRDFNRYVDVKLSVESLQKMRELYRLAKEGCASQAELEEYNRFQQFLTDRQNYAKQYGHINPS